MSTSPTVTEPRSARIVRWCDRLALTGMALGAALLLQPWLPTCFRTGFICLLASTLVQIVTSRFVTPAPKGNRD